MSDMYSDEHRELQDGFDSRKLADALENIIVHAEIAPEEKAYIESRNMFFLSTIDHKGRPSVSYKGGEKGFVKCVDAQTILFPIYDGNGMFLSSGNMKINNKVGLLFIDFEEPHRLRAYGEASVSKDDPELASYPEAQLIVRVKLTEIWINCPRYVHKHNAVETSKYVPKENVETPMPDWKKLDKLQPILPAKDQGKAESAGGTITMEELKKREARSDS